MRSLSPRRAALALVVGALAAPASVHAQSANPLQGLPPAPPPTTATTPVVSTGSSSRSRGGGVSGTAEGAIIGGALVLLLGIGYLIVRDARSAAPVPERAPGDTRTGAAERRRRERARAKAARRQRKRNR